jgi:hypothetical protein
MVSTDDVHETVKKIVAHQPLTPESDTSTESRRVSNKLNGVHSKSWRKTPGRRQRNQDELVFWRAMGQIVNIPSPALHTVQLQESFINTYLSSDVREAHAPFYRIFYWESPQNRSLRASREGLCLTHLGLRCKCVATMVNTTALTKVQLATKDCSWKDENAISTRSDFSGKTLKR